MFSYIFKFFKDSFNGFVEYIVLLRDSVKEVKKIEFPAINIVIFYLIFIFMLVIMLFFLLMFMNNVAFEVNNYLINLSI